MLYSNMEAFSTTSQGYVNLVEELENLRKRHCLSVMEMANKIGISYQGLRKILMGDTNKIHNKTLRQIKDAFNVYIEYIDDKIYFVEQPVDMPTVNHKTIRDAVMLQKLTSADYVWIMEFVKRRVKNAS